MKFYLITIFFILLFSCEASSILEIDSGDYATGPAGFTGENGYKGSAGESGTDGTDGLTGASGPTGAIGPSGQAWDCWGESNLTFSSIRINGTVLNGDTAFAMTMGQFYPIDFVVSGGAGSISSSISGIGGYIYPNGSTQFDFEPSISGGPFNFLATVNDQCRTVTKAFTIDAIFPGWMFVGPKRFSNGSSNAFYGALDMFVYQGTPYVAFSETAGIVGAVWVTKYRDGEWELFGDAAVNNWNAAQISLFIYNGTPYVAFDNKHKAGNGSVMYFNSSSWVTLGENFDFKNAVVKSQSLYVYNGTPYLAHCCVAGPFSVLLKYKEGDDTWQQVSTDFADESTEISLIVSNGTPYISYINTDQDPVIKHLNSSIWESDNLDTTNSMLSLSMSLENGTLFAAFIATDNHIKVKYKNGSGWSDVGSNPIYNGHLYPKSLSVYQGTPYIAFTELTSPQRISVMRYKASNWEFVGAPQFSYYNATSISLSVFNGTPFVSYLDDSVTPPTPRPTVRKYIDP